MGRPQTRQQKQRKPQRPSWWTELERQAEAAGLRGHRQWALVRFVARLGNGKFRGRNLLKGRRNLALELGLDVGLRSVDDPTPKGQGKHDLSGRNTRRRLQRAAQLGLLRLEGPVFVQAGQLARARGGRLAGCSKARYIGRAIRIYPGPLVYAKALIDRQVDLDDLADAGVIQWTQVSTPAEQLTPGELLALEELGRIALRRRGPP